MYAEWKKRLGDGGELFGLDIQLLDHELTKRPKDMS